MLIMQVQWLPLSYVQGAQRRTVENLVSGVLSSPWSGHRTEKGKKEQADGSS